MSKLLLLGLGSLTFSSALATTPIHLPARHHRVVIRGLLTIAHQSKSYSFRAHGGEHLGIDLKDLTPNFMTMYSITFPHGETYGMKGYDPFPGVLSQRGRYVIRVAINQMGSEGNRGHFRLTLKR